MSHQNPEDLLTDNKLNFIIKYTKNEDRNELKKLVLKIWKETKEGLAIFQCIQRFLFLTPRIDIHFYYPTLLNDLKSGKLKNKYFLDIGACFGGDIRDLILQGWDPSHIYVNDLKDNYWKKSLKLFGDQEALETKGINYAFGDLCVPEYVEVHYPSLTNKVYYVNAHSILHILSKSQIEQLLKNVYQIMSPSGSIFAGVTRCQDQEGKWFHDPRSNKTRYLHSFDSLKCTLTQFGFSNVKIEEIHFPPESREEGPSFFNVTYPNAKDANTKHVSFIAYKF